MPLDVPKTIDISSNYAVYQHIGVSSIHPNLKMGESLLGYSTISLSNTTHVDSKIFSIEYFRQGIFETLIPYFKLINQRETLNFISEKHWLVDSLINCYYFIESHIDNFEQIYLDYQEDVNTLYLHIHFEKFNYDYISSFRDKFFDFIIPQPALFEVLNISFSSDEV